jgi:glycosyltransferase involved in cell wall biosynthesis
METNPISRSISVFFPAFNDAHAIAPLVISALKILPILTDEYEVVVINDGSTDATPEVLEELVRTSKQVKVVHHPRNLGYGATLRSGFRHSTKDLIFYTDGDGQYDVRELLALYQELTPTVDVVNGFKRNRADKSHRKLLGGIYNQITRFLFRVPIRDVDCDFRLLRRSALERISLDSSSGVIGVELVHKLASAGCVFKEVPVHHYPRTHGKSQFFTPLRVGRTIFDYCLLWVTLVAFSGFLSTYPTVLNVFGE